MATKSAPKTEVAMDASVPTLIPCKVEEVEAPKRAVKRARKEAAPTDGASVAPAAPAAPRAKKSPVETEEAEGGEGEKASEAGNSVVVVKAVKGYLRASPTPMHCGSDAIPALNAKVIEILHEAQGRAHANGRKTLKSCDF